MPLAVPPPRGNRQLQQKEFGSKEIGNENQSLDVQLQGTL